MGRFRFSAYSYKNDFCSAIWINFTLNCEHTVLLASDKCELEYSKPRATREFEKLCQIFTSDCASCVWCCSRKRALTYILLLTVFIPHLDFYCHVLHHPAVTNCCYAGCPSRNDSRGLLQLLWWADKEEPATQTWPPAPLCRYGYCFFFPTNQTVHVCVDVALSLP